MLSFAIACMSRGAPVKDCSPAPIVDKKEPTKMTHFDGHANIDTINWFPMLSPNLFRNKWVFMCFKIIFSLTCPEVKLHQHMLQKTQHMTDLKIDINKSNSENARVFSNFNLHINAVVRTAPMVPFGIDLWASCKSPDLFEPAIIPTKSFHNLSFQNLSNNALFTCHRREENSKQHSKWACNICNNPQHFIRILVILSDRSVAHRCRCERISLCHVRIHRIIYVKPRL